MILPAVHVVWVTAACSGLAALAILMMPLHTRATTDAHDDKSPLAGWTLVRSNPMLRSLMVISLATMMLVAPLLAVLLPSHFRAMGRPEFLGLSLSAYAVGTMVGSGLYGVVFRGPATGGVVMAACWAAVSIWAVAAQSLRRYLQSLGEEDVDADHQPVG